MNRTTLLAAGAMAAAIAVSNSDRSAAQGVEIAVTCGGVGIGAAVCRELSEEWAIATGNRVTIVDTPTSTTEQLALLQQFLGGESPDIDVFNLDIIWTGLLGSYLIDLTPYLSPEEIDAHFPAIIANNRVDGELKAMPTHTDVGLLYYRTDLLEQYGLAVPETWDALEEAARIVQEGERAAGNERFWGFVWQGRAYEGLTCNALEWIDSHGGGTIVAADGSVTVNNPRAVAAIDRAAAWVGTISPPGVLNYQEEEARGVFQSGNALFMRNWPYAWGLAQNADSPVRGRIGLAPLPRGGADGRHTGTLGGWMRGVSRFSEHPEEAADLVRFLSGAEAQEHRSIALSVNPTIEALHDDPEVLAAAPFLSDLRSSFDNAIARPSTATGEHYNAVSAAFWTAVHRTLSGDGDAAANLAALESELIRMSRRGRW